MGLFWLGMGEFNLIVIGQRRKIFRLFLIFFELQFPEFIGEVNTKTPERHFPEAVQRKISTGDGGLLPDRGRKGIRGGKSDAALLVPYLLAESKIIGSKGRVFSLYLIAA